MIPILTCVAAFIVIVFVLVALDGKRVATLPKDTMRFPAGRTADDASLCPSCAWEGKLRDATWKLNDMVRCPKCASPVRSLEKRLRLRKRA